MKKKNLNDLRAEITAIDKKLVGLMGKRAKLSQAIGDVKKKKRAPIYSPEREAQVYANVLRENKGPLSAESLKAIYSEIMSACISLEEPKKIAYLGPEMTFTHQAALKKFGSSVRYVPCDTISGVFTEVGKGNADYGVVPIENSTEGAVNYTLDMFGSSDLMICSEVFLAIRHSLLAKRKNIKEVRKIYSKSEVFGQCRRWIEENLPSAKLYAVDSTAKAAGVAAGEKTAACIASELVAKKYPLNILARSIEDSATNVTRFLVIGDHIGKPSGKDKTSIMFSVKDRPGVLHDMLSSFKSAGINLTKIESRPSKRGLWKYYFFVDLEGHREDKKIKKALETLEKKCHFLKVLGSYPVGK
ncbi:MAG: prephenate dehydratase [Candidatus Omnitrophica bacterium]|nr:prephenate dehydratase [Candidatus Omnitrophota bacterium]